MDVFLAEIIIIPFKDNYFYEILHKRCFFNRIWPFYGIFFVWDKTWS